MQRVHIVDERDCSWEIDKPTFRVGIWERLQAADQVGEEESGWSLTTWEVSGSHYDDVRAWAVERLPAGGRMTIGVVVEDPTRGLGLIHLVGNEPIRSDDDM